MTQPAQGRGAVLAAYFILDFVITSAALVVFGAFGGFMLLLALNGFSSRDATPIIVGYCALVILGNLVATTLANLLLRRLWPLASARPRTSAFAAACVTTALLMLVGPPAAVVIMKFVLSH
jgi:hypothetical protein